jgi:thiol-disulfide isomerase/thioredoxin
MGILALVLVSCIGEGAPADDGSRVRVGDPVPQFGVDDFVSPGDFLGRKSLLVLFNTGCPDCQRELPVIDAACRELPDMQAIALSRDENVTAWGYVMTPYPDPARAVYNLFAEHTIPRVYLIDETGTVVWMAIEKLPANFKQQIDEIFY